MKGKKLRHLAAMLLCLAVATTALYACSSGGGQTQAPAATTAAPAAPADSSGQSAAAAPAAQAPADTAAAPAGPDISEHVDLELLMIGDAPRDMDRVTALVNEKLNKDINATIKFNYTTFTDAMQKYNLALSSGQNLDVIYTATFQNYSQLAARGAFHALDDLLPVYAPKLYAMVPQEYWDGVRVNGKIYTVPNVYKQFLMGGFIYRKDLQEKYNLPVPKDAETIEQLMLGFKENMPGQLLTNEFPMAGIYQFNFSAIGALDMYHGWANTAIYGLAAPYDDPGNLFNYWESPEFVEEMKLMKRWADLGFWSRSALSNVEDMSAMQNGKTVARFFGGTVNTVAEYNAAVAESHPDWKFDIFLYSDMTGVYYPTHPMHEGLAIPIASKHPERALMFIEELIMDKEINHLTSYGIEGEHYMVDEDGWYVALQDPATSGFTWEQSNPWAWRNSEFMLLPKEKEYQMERYAEMEPKAGPNYIEGFAEDYESYQTERAALGTVMTQYLQPLHAGLVDDVEASVKTFLEQAKLAGLEKVQEEYSKQWKAYIDTYAK
ncbi:MAG: extracellular solute-binding protein [Lachnospiraceae bacterium]|jgi:putative aldouronate transport system substrate-binding protein|nr:extracellular solute-binding protein [Lachnospiraceae bacterium]